MKQKLKTLQLIHLALCVGPILAFLGTGKYKELTETSTLFSDTSSMVYLAIPVLAVIFSRVMFQRLLKNIDPKLTLEEKFPGYHTACIVSWAIIEGAAFYLLMAQEGMAVLALVLLVYLVFIRPTEDKIKTALSEF